MPVAITPINETTYGMQSGRDFVVLGDADAPICRAHVLYQRWNGLTAYALGYPGTPSGLAMVDMYNGIIRIPYGTVSVELSGIECSDDTPDGRVEFNVILNEKPIADANGEYWQVLDFAVAGLQGFERILGLDEEYDQARCAETWDHDPAPFTITPTEIRNADGVLLMSRPEHVVHSLKGRASQNVHTKSPPLGFNKKLGKDITYACVSRDTLRLPRRLLTDSRGNTARIEDVVLDGDQIKFKLPVDFIKKAKYPVKHATGADPAYTQDMDYWVTGGYGDTDGWWSDYDLYTNKGVPKGAVAEIIVANQEAGYEALLGIRTDGSSVVRMLNMHEAESGGETHCRQFVVCHATTGLVETYADDVSDENLFYVVGYWENISFVERLATYYPTETATWHDVQLGVGASVLHHVLLVNMTENTNKTIGVRAKGSSLERKLVLHETEGGGGSWLDMMVMTDASRYIQGYVSSISGSYFYDGGYFGADLEFVEGWQEFSNHVPWGKEDLTAYLDEDGRHVDMMVVSGGDNYEENLGVRDGDDTSTERKLMEHEAEGVGGEGTEWTGFTMSGKTNASGEVYVMSGDMGGGKHFFAGYYVPAGGAVTYTKTMDIDMLLRKTQTKTMDVDMLLRKTQSKTMDIDAVLKLRQSKTMDIDVLIQKTFEQGMDIDVLLQKGFTKEMLIDMLLRKTFTQTMDIDVLLQLRLLKTMDIDMLLERRGVLKTMEIDLQLLKRQIEKTMDIDVVLMKQYTKTMDVDMLLKKLGVTKTMDIDVQLQKRGIEKTMDIDVLVMAPGSYKTMEIDMLLRKTLAQTMEIDALLRKTFSKTMDIDVQVRKPGIEKTMDVDVLLRKGFTKTMTVDMLLRKTQTATMDIDVILQVPSADNIAKIDGVLWSGVSAVFGVPKTGIAKIMGVEV